MAKKELDFVIKVNNKELDLTKTSFKDFKKIIADARKELQNLPIKDPRYKVLTKEIADAEKAWKAAMKSQKDFNDESEDGGKKVSTYSQQIRIATRELIAIEQQFGKNSAEYEAQTQKIKDLREAQEELTRGTQKFDDALANIPGPIGQIGQGLQQLEVVSQSAKSALSSLGASFKGLDGVIKGTGIGLIVVAIVTLIAALTDAAQKSAPLQKAFAAIGDAVGALFDALKPVTDFLINVFVGAVNMAARAINVLASLFGGVSQNFKQNTIQLEKTINSQKLILEQYSEFLSQHYKDLLSLQIKYNERRKALNEDEKKSTQDKISELKQLDFQYLVEKDLLEKKYDKIKRDRDIELSKANKENNLDYIDNERITQQGLINIEQKAQQDLADSEIKAANGRIIRARLLQKQLEELQGQGSEELQKQRREALKALKKSIDDELENVKYLRNRKLEIQKGGNSELLKNQREFARQDTAAINERSIKIMELTTSLIKEENARNLQAAKDRLVSLKEEHRLELEQAKLQGITLTKLEEKQAAERKVAREEIRKAQIQVDVYNLKNQVDEENRRLTEELTRDEQYYQRKRENVLKEYEIDYKLADKNVEKLKEARTKQFVALIEIDKEELSNMRSNLELEYDGMYQVSAEAFDKLREIEKKRFEEQKKGNEQNFQYIEALTKQHYKNLEMIDVSELNTMADLLQRKADARRDITGRYFKKAEEAENIYYAARVKAAGDNVALIETIEMEHQRKLRDLHKERMDAWGQITSQMLSGFANLAGAIAAVYEFESQNTKKTMAERKAAFEQNKKYQKATALLSAASGVIQILTQPSTLPSPFDWIVKIANAAALGIMTAVQIKKIDASEFNDTGAGAGAGGGTPYNGLGRNYAEGGMIKGRRHSEGGVVIEAEDGEAIMTRGAVSMFGPMLSMMNQMGGGTPFNRAAIGGARPDNPNVSNPTSENKPIIVKSYVVSQDMQSELQKQARLKDLSTL